MAEPALDLPDDLLPPELLVDEVPITEDDLDEFAELVRKVADSVGCSQEDALELLWEPPNGDDGVYDEDGNLVASMPAGYRDAVSLDEERADWAMARYAQAEAAIAAAKDRHRKLVAKLDEWKATALRRPTNDKAFFGMLLTSYGLEARRASGDKVATFTMPSGKVATRTKNKGGALDVTDQAAVAEWLRTTVGAAWLDRQLSEATEALAGETDPESIRSTLDLFAERLLTADPYDGAINAKGEVLKSKLGAHVGIVGGAPRDLDSGDPVPGVVVVPESIGVTITPN